MQDQYEPQPPKSTAAGGLKRKAESKLMKKTRDGPVNKKNSPLKELPKESKSKPKTTPSAANTLLLQPLNVDEKLAEDVYKELNSDEVARETVDAADMSTAVPPHGPSKQFFTVFHCILLFSLYSVNFHCITFSLYFTVFSEHPKQ